MNRKLLKKEIQLADKHFNKCSTSLAVREMKIEPHEIPCLPSQNGYQTNKYCRVWREGSLYTLLVGIHITPIGATVKAPQNL